MATIDLPPFPLSKDTIKGLHITKDQLLELMGLDEHGVDYALPQKWLDFFVAEYGEDFGFTYSDMLFTTFYQYKTNSFGMPITGCLEVDNAFKKAGLLSYTETMELIEESQKLKKGDN